MIPPNVVFFNTLLNISADLLRFLANAQNEPENSKVKFPSVYVITKDTAGSRRGLGFRRVTWFKWVIKRRTGTEWNNSKMAYFKINQTETSIEGMGSVVDTFIDQCTQNKKSLESNENKMEQIKQEFNISEENTGTGQCI